MSGLVSVILRSVMSFLMASCILLILTGRSHASHLYHVTDLGLLPDATYSQAVGISNNGQIVGNSGVNGGHAAQYSNGTVTDLGTLGGAHSYAMSVNDAGQAVGFSYIDDSFTTHAFLFQNGVMHDLGVLPGGSQSQAYGINNSGQVVGITYFTPTNNPSYAFVYSNGSMTNLGTLGGSYSTGRAINDLGQVVGGSLLNGGGLRAFLYSDGIMSNLGTLPGGNQSQAFAINDIGRVVGFSAVSTGYVHAFFYGDNAMSDLGVLPGHNTSVAYGINDNGQIVGESGIQGVVQRTAFLYSDGTMIDLNKILDSSGDGWNLQHANAINSSGAIVGSGFSPNGQQHAFLLTPVPEPSAIALLLIGSCGVAYGLHTQARRR